MSFIKPNGIYTQGTQPLSPREIPYHLVAYVTLLVFLAGKVIVNHEEGIYRLTLGYLLKVLRAQPVVGFGTERDYVYPAASEVVSVLNVVSQQVSWAENGRHFS